MDNQFSDVNVHKSIKGLTMENTEINSVQIIKIKENHFLELICVCVKEDFIDSDDLSDKIKADHRKFWISHRAESPVLHFATFNSPFTTIQYEDIIAHCIKDTNHHLDIKETICIDNDVINKLSRIESVFFTKTQLDLHRGYKKRSGVEIFTLLFRPYLPPNDLQLKQHNEEVLP